MTKRRAGFCCPFTPSAWSRREKVDGGMEVAGRRTEPATNRYRSKTGLNRPRPRKSTRCSNDAFSRRSARPRVEKSPPQFLMRGRPAEVPLI